MKGFLLLVLFYSVFAADPCIFPPATIGGVVTTVAVTNVTATLACFKSIPLNINTKNATLIQLFKLVDLYSFTDISVNSPPPYSLQVDLKAGLTTIMNTVQASDWDFHYQVATLFAGLGDAHTLYSPPGSYSGFFLLHPLSITSQLDANGNQIFIAQQSNVFGTTVSTITGVSVTNYVGAQILTINGQTPTAWLLAKGKGMGTVKDPAVQFNNALMNSGFSGTNEVNLATLTNSDVYTFAGVANPVTLPNIVVSVATFASTAAFVAGNAPAPTKRYDQSDLHRLAFNKKQFGSYTTPTDPIRDRQRFFQLPIFTDPTLSGLSYWDLMERARFREIKTDLQEVMRYNPLSGVQKRGVPTLTTVAVSNSTSAFCLSFLDSRGATTMILGLTTFAPPPNFVTNADVNGWIASFSQTIQTCISTAKAQAIPNLVVDVRSNGGGIICLALSSIVSIFNDLDPATTAALFEPYDMRRTAANDILIQYTDTFTDYVKLPATTATPVVYTDNTYYTAGNVNDVRGGVTGTYTAKWGFPAGCLPLDANYFVVPQGYKFSKVAIFTDGLCGSACSLFLSKIRYNGRAATISLGGIVGQPIETSSFSGGNVEDWTNIIPFFQQNAAGTANANFFQLLPTNAFTRYNHRESYMGNQPFPREFQRFTPDIQLKAWFPRSQNDTLYLFDTVAAQFLNFPAIQPLGGNYGTPYVSGSYTAPGTTATNAGTNSVTQKNSASSLVPLLLTLLVALLFI